MLEIIDNFLPQEEFFQIQKTMLYGEFPWYVNHGVSPTTSCDPKYNYQLYHMFYQLPFTIDKELTLLDPIMYKINPQILLKIKANLNPCTDQIQTHGYHIDMQDSISDLNKTAVFYLNTNNGYTIFEDGTQIESIANRLAIFDGNIQHSGTTCTDQSYRAVINFNYIQGKLK
jgi:hypothetical protein